MHAGGDFDPRRALGELVEGGVDFVVIGAIAGGLFGSSALTADLDICYARDQANLEALAAVLRKLNARLRGAVPGRPFRLDARTLRAGDSFTFTTDQGDLDILGTPAGTSGYADLVERAEAFEVDGLTVMVASIDDQIRMKRAAGRPKDLYQVEILLALKDEIDKGR